LSSLYLIARRRMRRLAALHGIDVGHRLSHYKKSLVLSIDPEQALRHGREALLSLPHGITLDADETAEGEVGGRTGKSDRSFGERVVVQVGRTTAGRAAIEISSRPFGMQLFDGGINAENVAAIDRYLTARAAIAGRVDVPEKAETGEQEIALTGSDWLALVYLALVAVYTGAVIMLAMFRPDWSAVWSDTLRAFRLDPLSVLGVQCQMQNRGAGLSVVLQLNILILPTFLVYGTYNVNEFLRARERMDSLNWSLFTVSLFALPLFVLTGCSAEWAAFLTPKYELLAGFIFEHAWAGAIYAALLLIFTNGLTYLPSWLAARGIKTIKKRDGGE
jgi:hypothetical protein